MDFELSSEQQMIVDTATEVGKKYGADYWFEKDQNHSFPSEFLSEMGELGFFGLHLPEALGGSNAGITEMVLAMEALCSAGGGGGPALGFLFGILGSNAVMQNGTTEQKNHYLRAMAKGEVLASLGITEPDAGTNTLNITTFAEKQGDDYVINGAKWFITNIEQTQVFLLLAKTEKKQSASSMSLFLIDLPNERINASPIAKHGLHYYQSYNVQFDDLRVPASCLLGEEGKGFYQLLGTLNPERLLVAAGAIGTGRLALRAAVTYANERDVFNKPIGAHQAVQHPLAAAHAKMESAWLSILKAASMHDAGKDNVAVGHVANMAKYVAVEASIEACYHAMQTFGGAGFAADYHVERWWREVQLFRLAPLTQQMSLNYIGEHVLGMPKSY
jgi:acyl-CoA dehydrogenase